MDKKFKFKKYLISIDGMDSDVYYNKQKVLKEIHASIENNAKRILIKIENKSIDKR